MIDLQQRTIFLKKNVLLCLSLLSLIAEILVSCKKSDTAQNPEVKLQRIILTIDTINIIIGSQSKINYTIFPANSTDTIFTFSSSSPSVATVQAGGLITGVKLGSTKIIIANSASGVSATCVVNVLPLKATSLLISESTIAMNVGQKDTLTATFEPANAVSQTLVWSSSNTTVATVDAKGVVAAINAGNAVITIGTIDGQLHASCTATVAPANVTGIKVDSTKFMLLNGTSLKMGYAMLPLDASRTGVTWTSDNSAVASVLPDGTINGLSVGTADITAKTGQGGFTSTCTVLVVNIGSFLDSYLYSTSSTATGQLVETDSLASFNYSLYDVNVFEIDVYNNENKVIGSLKNSAGTPLYILKHAAGVLTPGPSQSFIVSQVEPGANTRQNWPVVVYFTCNGANYKMTLTSSSTGYANQVIVKL